MGKKPNKHQRDLARSKQKKAEAAKPIDNYSRPENFQSLVDTVTYAKKSVYAITRLREINGKTFAATIGTGFLVSPYKLMTSAHVIESIDPQLTRMNNPLAFHEDGDIYYLLNKDPYDQDHYYRLNATLGKNLHLYPQVDAAIITVDDNFYCTKTKVIQNKDVFLKLSKGPHPLGTKVVVLGYPAEEDDQKRRGIYIEEGTNQLNDGLIKKRVDRGVINARYKDPKDNVTKYDFTTSFNPGNSGGPIVEEDGSVVAIVHGFRSFPVQELKLSYEEPQDDGTKKKKTMPYLVTAAYSIGFAVDNFDDIVNEHGLETQ